MTPLRVPTSSSPSSKLLSRLLVRQTPKRNPQQHHLGSSIRTFQSSRNLSLTPTFSTGTQNSRPGWDGRHGDDHVLNRDGLDTQSESSIDARKDKENAQADPNSKEGGQGVHESDDGNHNKRAKEEFPESPGPVIGMNDERGGKGH